jgi:predicted NBD/HSP70 family sugar kinase
VSDSAGALLALVRAGLADTRADLRRRTGLSRTAVDARVAQLVGAGLLVSGGELSSTGGRPPAGLRLNPDAGVVLAVALGRSRHQLGAFDLVGTELGSFSADHEVGAGPDVVMPEVARSLATLLADHGGGRPVLGIGLSLPGTADAVHGVSVDSPVMAGWDGIELAPYLADVADGAPLFVGNDADGLALSERLARGGSFEDLLVLKASTGIGLGIVAGGRLVTGHLGAAGELGHTKVDAAAGRPCRCGDTGCLETVAGGWALVASVADSRPDVHHVRDLVALALDGDAEVRQLLRESGRRTGEVLAVAVNLLNPRAIVVGGDMSAAFDVYAAGVRESVFARSSALSMRDLLVMPAHFGDRAGLVGAGTLALDHLLAPDAVDARLAHRVSTPG